MSDLGLFPIDGPIELPPAMTPESPLPAWTERRVADVFQEHHDRVSSQGVGKRYVVARQVRNKGGFEATRTLDLVLIDTWQSKRFALHAVEIKVSRSDWLRELKDPEKGAAALEVCDTMSVCAPEGVVKSGELPDGWGQWVVDQKGHGGTLRSIRCVKSPRLPKVMRRELDRSFVVALLRAQYREVIQHG